MANGSGGTGDGGVNGSAVLGKGGNIDIADALTGEGQRLGVRIADNGIFIQIGDKGDLYTTVDQLTVGLIGDDVDGVAVLTALAF